MTTMCEIAESVGEATNSYDVANIVVAANSASALNGVVLGLTVSLASVAAAVSSAHPSSYALLTSIGVASNPVSNSLIVTPTLTSDAVADSHMFVATPVTLTSTAAAVDAISGYIPFPVLTSVATAVDAVSPRILFSRTEASIAEAVDLATVYYEQSLSSAAVAADSFAFQLLSYESVSSTAAATSTALASNTYALPVLGNAGVATTSLVARSDWQVVGESSANAVSAVVFRDPGRVAWLMNTESAAVSWYDNFDFESIAQVNGVAFAVGPGGIFELTGDTDDGDTIDASLRSGFMDFGTQLQKRVDSIHIGYVSTGTLRATVRTKDSGHAASTFTMEPRSANAPRNSRITPGKGLVGAYWQVEIRNVSGAPFTVYDTSIDLAVSSRKF